MILYHATRRRNLASIKMLGLCPSFSKGKIPAVWLHTSSRRSWAALHTVRRHGGTIEGVVVLRVSVPRSWLVRSHAKGMWAVKRQIPWSRVQEVVRFEVLSQSPLEGVL